MKDKVSTIATTKVVAKEAGKDLSPTKVKLSKDGKASVTKLAVPASRKPSEKIKVSSKGFYVWGELTDSQQARLYAWMQDGGMDSSKRAPQFKGKLHQKKNHQHKTLGQWDYLTKKAKESLANNYNEKDHRCRYVTLNQDGSKATTSDKVTKNRFEKWIEKVNASGLTVESYTAFMEKNVGGEIHVHALLRFKPNPLLFNKFKVDDRLASLWDNCEPNRINAQVPYDLKGLTKYLIQNYSQAEVSSEGDIKPDLETAEAKSKAELNAKNIAKAVKGTGKAEELAKKAVRKSHLEKKHELAKNVKRNESVVIFSTGQAKSVQLVANEKVVSYLEANGTYSHTTKTTIQKVDRATGEMLGTVQVIVKDWYRVEDVEATIAELQALDALQDESEVLALA